MDSAFDLTSAVDPFQLRREWQVTLGREPLAEPEQLLDRCPELLPKQVVDVLLVDQYLKWQHQPGPRVEEYLRRFPVVASADDCVLDLVYGEARAREKLGFTVRWKDFAARFPHLAESVRIQFEIATWLSDSSLPVHGEHAASSTSQMSLPRPNGTHSDAPVSGTEFGEYVLLGDLGRGGMGVIYRARHRVLGRIVALKALSGGNAASAGRSQRFRVEMQAVGRLDHPHIAPIYDVGEVDGTPFFTTRLAENGTLADCRERFVGHSRRIAGLMAATARAVHHAHERGVLHRDLKPSNVLLDRNLQPMLADFGLAHLMEDSAELTQTGELVGSPVWLAPERAASSPGPPGVLVDVYGLGAILYFLLTGRAPHEGHGLLDTLARVRDESVRRPRQVDPAVDRDLEAVCMAAMRREPECRYASAETFAEDLERYLRGEPIIARPLAWHEQLRRWVHRHPVVAAVAGTMCLCGLILIGMASWYTWRQIALGRSLQQSISNAAAAESRADTMRAEAESARDQMLDARLGHRRMLYAARVRSAGAAIDVGDIRRAHDALEREIPDSMMSDQRGFEWLWLRRQCSVGDPLREVSIHNPRCLQCSPNGTRVAVGDSLGRCTVLDAESMTTLHWWLTPHEMVESVSYSPSGELLVTAGHDSTVRVWSAATGTLQTAVDIGAGDSCRVAFLDDHRLVVCGRHRPSVMVELTEPPVVTVLSALAEVEAMDVAVHPSSGRCAFVGWKTVGVCRMSTDAERPAELQFVWPRNGGRTAAWSLDGRLLALSDEGGVIDVLSVQEPGEPQQVAAYRLLDEVRSTVFSTGGNLYAACGTGAVFMANPDISPPSALLRMDDVPGWQAHEDRINAVAVSPVDGRVMTGSRDNFVRAWQPVADSGVRVLSEDPTPQAADAGITVLPGRDRILSVGTGELTEWDLLSRTIAGRTAPDGQIRDRIAVSPDGSFVAAARMWEEPFVEVWSRSEASASHPAESAADSELVATSEESVTPPNAVRFSSLWKLGVRSCHSLAMSPDGRLLAVVDGQNDTVLLLDTRTGAAVRDLPIEQPHCAVFSPDGRLLVVTSLDAAVVWDCTTWRKLYQTRGHSSTAVIAAVSPDSSAIATGSHDRSVRLYDADTGAETHRLLGHSDWVEDLAFSPDGRSLVTASRDGTVKVWHVETGEFLCDLERRETNRVFRLAFCTPSGKLAMRLERGQLILLNTGARD